MPDGSRLLLLERGGRVLGLWPPGDPQSFFWLNENATGWNVGGDRTWISPEVDVFVPEFPDTSVFRVPVGLDPGAYRFSGDSPRLSSRCALALSRSGKLVELEIEKSWEPAPDPLRAKNVRYAGYSQTTELRCANRAKAPVAIWNIVQVPHGGEALLPVHGRSRPRLYFGDIPPEDLRSDPHMIRYLARRPGLAKFGIDPISATGRLGYLWTSGEGMNLVVRNIAVNPWTEYGDVVWTNPREMDGQGCAIQICSVDNELGAYVELEYHAPMGHSDVSQLCAYRGSEEAIFPIARQLLGVS